MYHADDRPKRMLLSIPDAAYALGVSENHIRNLIADGTLQRVNLGRRVLVSVASIERFIAGEVERSASSESREISAEHIN